MSSVPSELDASAEPQAQRDANRELFWAGLVAFAISRLYLALFMQPQITDTSLYFNAAARAYDLEQPIYVGDNKLGYPPVAWWMMLAPRLADPRPAKAGEAAANFARYRALWRLEMLALDFVALALFVGAVARRRPRQLATAAWGLTLVGMALYYVLYDRTDLGVWVCVALWAWAWSRRGPDGRFDLWTALAAAAIGLGMAVKLVTAVMVPFVLLGVWQSRRKWGDAVAAAGAMALAAGLPFVVYLPTAGGEVFYFLERHGGRSVQLESVYATALMLLRPLGVAMQPIYDTNAWNLDSAWTPTVRILATMGLFGGLLAAALWAWRQRDRFDGRLTYCASGLALAGLLCVAHVLSPQYMLWGLGALLLVGCELNERAYLGLVVTAVVIALLTTFVFPFHFDATYDWAGRAVAQPRNLVRAFDSLPCAALVLRNALYVGLVVWTSNRLLRPAFSVFGRPGSAFGRPEL